METRLIAQEEFYWLEGLSQQEVQFLSGVVCGIKSSLSLRSHFVYIEDMNSHLVVWMSHACYKLEQSINRPLSVEDLSLYANQAEAERIARLDQLALNFIKEHDSVSLDAYSIRSNAFVGAENNQLIYDRIVRFLSIRNSLAPRFCVYRLSVSTHTELREMKVYKDGDIYYYKLKPGHVRWNKKLTFSLNRCEQLILIHSSKGLTESEIAGKLHLSLSRIKSIKAKVFRQLHVKNIPQAIERAYKYGLITFPASHNKNDTLVYEK